MQHTALAPRHSHQLLFATREFHEQMLCIRDQVGAVPSTKILSDVLSKSGALTEVIRRIGADRSRQPKGDPVVYCGVGQNSKTLKGVDAFLYLKQITSLQTLLSELFDRWGWTEFIGDEGIFNIEGMVSSFERLPRPTIHHSDLVRVKSALETFDIPGTDLTHLTQEEVSSIPPPMQRGPGSWKIPGASPFMPGEEATAKKDGPDLVRIIQFDGVTQQWIDLASCRKWPVDQPYALIPADPSDSSRGLQIARFGHDAYFVGGKSYEFRFVLQSNDGRFFLLGAPSHQWYRDKLATPEGMLLLLNEPRFHAEIALVNPSDRGLLPVNSEGAKEILVDSGYSGDLPSELEPDYVNTYGEDSSHASGNHEGVRAGQSDEVEDENPIGPQPSRTGYLSIQIYEGTFELGRDGFRNKVRLGSGIIWLLFNAIESSKDSYYRRERVRSLWDQAGLQVNPQDNTIDDRISDLRKELKKIGANVATQRKVGWRLENLAE